MKKLSLVLVIALVAIFAMTACAPTASAPAAATEAMPEATAEATTEAMPEESAAAPAEATDMNIQVIAKGFQHQFWQTVAAGANQAATDLGVTIEFNGPPTEQDIQAQVDMINSALSKAPDGLALASLDTDAVISQLQQAKDAGIPVVGFDSGVPNAPEGTIVANASTNNKAAAGVGATEMLKNKTVADKVKAATKDAPVTVVVFSQDATSESIISRTEGFIEQFVKEAEAAGAVVSVTGHDKFKKEVADATVNLNVVVPPTSSTEDLKNAGQALLNADDLIAIFCSNEGSVGGLLNATNDGKDFDKTEGKYKDVVVVGFDAGKPQKEAIKNGWFYGSVTQDPFQIGYQAVELAVKAAKGETVADVDTGAQWYNADNLDDEMISMLVYD